MIRLIGVFTSVVSLWLLGASIVGEERLNRWGKGVRHFTEALRACTTSVWRQRLEADFRETLRTTLGGQSTPLIPIVLVTGLLALSVIVQPYSSFLVAVILLILVIVSPGVVFLLLNVLAYALIGVATMLVSTFTLLLFILFQIMSVPYLILNKAVIQNTLERVIFLIGLLLGMVGAALADF
jgi:hypothetical protein